MTVTLIGKDDNGERNEDDFVAHDAENVTTGRGNDTIDADDNLKGEVKCGAGSDLVTADPDDRVAGDCENVQVSALGNRCTASTTNVRMSRSGAIPVRVFCAVTAKGTLRLQSVARGARRPQAQGGEDREQVVLAQGRSTQDDHRQGLEVGPPPDSAQEAAERARPGLRQDSGGEVGVREQQRLHGQGREVTAMTARLIQKVVLAPGRLGGCARRCMGRRAPDRPRRLRRHSLRTGNPVTAPPTPGGPEYTQAGGHPNTNIYMQFCGEGIPVTNATNTSPVVSHDRAAARPDRRAPSRARPCG